MVLTSECITTGQKEVLEGILEYVDIRKRGAIERARASGLDVQEVLDVDD